MGFIQVVTYCSQRHFMLGTFFKVPIPSLLFIHNLQAIFLYRKKISVIVLQSPNFSGSQWYSEFSSELLWVWLYWWQFFISEILKKMCLVQQPLSPHLALVSGAMAESRLWPYSDCWARLHQCIPPGRKVAHGALHGRGLSSSELCVGWL